MTEQSPATDSVQNMDWCSFLCIMSL